MFECDCKLFCFILNLYFGDVKLFQVSGMSKRIIRQRKIFGYNGGGIGWVYDEQLGLCVFNYVGVEQGLLLFLILFVDVVYVFDIELSEINFVQFDVIFGWWRFKRIWIRKLMDVIMVLVR